MAKQSSRFLLYLLVIFTLLLASCAGNGNGAATGTVEPGGEVPATGETLAVEPTEPIVEEPTEDMAVEETPTEEMAVEETPTEDMAAEPNATEEMTAEETPVDGDGVAIGEGPMFEAEEIGGTVNVLVIWGGEELANFEAMLAPFQEQTGIQVQIEQTRDLGAVLNTRIEGGNPPDVAGLPNPGQLNELADQGALVALNDVIDMEGMQGVYDEGFLDLASVDGQMYGIWTKAAVKSLVWYNPPAFEAAGLTVPTNWEELDALEQQIIGMGATPWCVGIDGGAGSGWPGTDWVEDFMLRTGGPETYDQWWRHEIPWTDPAVVEAFETWGTVINDEAMVFGGPLNANATNFGEAFVPMFEDEPSCYLHRQASFITTFFTEQFPELEAGTDYDFFVLPPIEGEAAPLLVAGDLFGMFNDTPQARALIQYLVTAEAQTIWAERGGYLSANRAVDPATYPDQITQQIGDLIVNAPAVRFDASDLMPQAVSSAFSTGVLEFVGNPDQLESILQQIESVAEGAYQEAQ